MKRLFIALLIISAFSVVAQAQSFYMSTSSYNVGKFNDLSLGVQYKAFNAALFLSNTRFNNNKQNNVGIQLGLEKTLVKFSPKFGINAGIFAREYIAGRQDPHPYSPGAYPTGIPTGTSARAFVGLTYGDFSIDTGFERTFTQDKKFHYLPISLSVAIPVE